MEKSLSGSNSFEETLVKADLNDISSESSKVGNTVIRGDNDALVNSLDLTHSEILVENLLLDEIAVPNTDTVVVDSNDVVVGVVEESDLVCDVHANRVATDGFS